MKDNIFNIPDLLPTGAVVVKEEGNERIIKINGKTFHQRYSDFIGWHDVNSVKVEIKIK